MTFSNSWILFFLIPQFGLWIYIFFKNKDFRPIFSNESNSVGLIIQKNMNYQLYNWKNSFLYFGIFILTLAASGPQIGTKVKPIERKGVDLVIALDISSSMDAEDITPSRIEKAKFEIGKLINELNGDRVAIIVFAGTSHLYLPLTSDYEAAMLFLREIDTNMIPTQGTNLSAAINTALAAFVDQKDKYKVMILISDGEDHEGKAVDLASKAASMGMVINAVGVGSKEGGLIPVNNLQSKNSLQSLTVSNKYQNKNKFKRDKKGSLVTSIINEKIMRDIATAGNGSFFLFGNNKDSYLEILDFINNMEKKTISMHEFSEYEDRYQIFSIIAMTSLIISFIFPTREKTKFK